MVDNGKINVIVSNSRILFDTITFIFLYTSTKETFTVNRLSRRVLKYLQDDGEAYFQGNTEAISTDLTVVNYFNEYSEEF